MGIVTEGTPETDPREVSNKTLNHTSSSGWLLSLWNGIILLSHNYVVDKLLFANETS